jgi:hypothetical protein
MTDLRLDQPSAEILLRQRMCLLTMTADLAAQRIEAILGRARPEDIELVSYRGLREIAAELRAAAERAVGSVELYDPIEQPH